MAGKTKYSLRKMLNLAIDGIVSFSMKPLHCISVLGIICSGLSVVGLFYALISHFFGYTVKGWIAIVCSNFFMSGVQLLALGITGEYIGKIFA